MNGDISIAIEQIIMSAKQRKRPHIIIFICMKMTRHFKLIVKRKRQYLHWSAFFVKLIHFQITIQNKK